MSFLGGSYESVFITFLSVDQDTTLFFLCFYLGTSYLTYSKPTPVFLPGESQGRGSLVGCRPWGRTESDTTEVT